MFCIHKYNILMKMYRDTRIHKMENFYKNYLKKSYLENFKLKKKNIRKQSTKS